MLSDSIRSYRKAAGLSQAGLAKKLGVFVTAVSQWETGTTRPTLANTIAISRVLGVSLDELVKESPVQLSSAQESVILSEEANITSDTNVVQDSRDPRDVLLAAGCGK